MGKRLKKYDLAQLYDKFWGTLDEDRQTLLSQYADLRAYVQENPERFATVGDTLGKYAEILVKQNAQLIEVLKLASKDVESDTLSEADIAAIHGSLNENSEEE